MRESGGEGLAAGCGKASRLEGWQRLSRQLLLVLVSESCCLRRSLNGRGATTAAVRTMCQCPLAAGCCFPADAASIPNRTRRSTSTASDPPRLGLCSHTVRPLAGQDREKEFLDRCHRVSFPGMASNDDQQRGAHALRSASAYVVEAGQWFSGFFNGLTFNGIGWTLPEGIQANRVCKAIQQFHGVRTLIRSGGGG